MKKDVAIIVILSIVAVILITIVAVIVIRGRNGEEKESTKPVTKPVKETKVTEPKEKAEVKDFDEIHLKVSHSPRGGSYTYEILCEGDQSVINKKNNFKDGEIVATVTIDTKAVIDVLNEYDILSWDGFDGERPEGVQDGTDFSLDAKINGKDLEAEGHTVFPDHFNDFVKWIESTLPEEE